MTLPARPYRRGPCRLLAAGLLFLALAGCATPQLDQMSRHPPAGLAPRAEVRGVPFVAQDDYQCGPAALAMVLNASGSRVTAEDLVPQVWLPARKGSLQVEMLATARRNGLVALELPPSLEDLMSELAAGHPVIVLQNLGLEWYPVWHYSVAIGYDVDAGTIALRSGRAQREEMSLATFERTWARSGRWAMLALAPGTLPASVESTAYLDAVVRLESAGQPRAARAAYAAAAERWPQALTAWIGLGNTAYSMHDLASAEDAFRRAAASHPESVAALNNLAQTLYERGEAAEALVTARRAAALGGPLQPAARRTLESLEAVAPATDPSAR